MPFLICDYGNISYGTQFYDIIIFSFSFSFASKCNGFWFWRVTNLCISLEFSEHASVRYFQLQITEGNFKTISNNAVIWFAEILPTILSLLLLKSFDYLLVRGALYHCYDIRFSAAIDLMHIFFSLFVFANIIHTWMRINNLCIALDMVFDFLSTTIMP